MRREGKWRVVGSKKDMYYQDTGAYGGYMYVDVDDYWNAQYIFTDPSNSSVWGTAVKDNQVRAGAGDGRALRAAQRAAAMLGGPRPLAPGRAAWGKPPSCYRAQLSCRLLLAPPHLLPHPSHRSPTTWMRPPILMSTG